MSYCEKGAKKLSAVNFEIICLTLLTPGVLIQASECVKRDVKCHGSEDYKHKIPANSGDFLPPTVIRRLFIIPDKLVFKVFGISIQLQIRS